MSVFHNFNQQLAYSLCLLLFTVQDAVSLSVQPMKYVNIINLLDRSTSYSRAWDLQLDLMQHHMRLQDDQAVNVFAVEGAGVCVGTVVVCQHSPTYTLGSATTQGSGPFSKIMADGSSLEYETFTVERAGQATFHGPGQLVVYPILDLTYFSKDIHLYLRGLEQTIIDTLSHFDIASQRIEGNCNNYSSISSALPLDFSIDSAP